MKLKYILIAFLGILILGMVIPAVKLITAPKKGKMSYSYVIRQLTNAVIVYRDNFKMMPLSLQDVVTQYEDELISPEFWTPDNSIETFRSYKYNNNADDKQAVIEIITEKRIYQGFLNGDIITTDKNEG